MGVWWIGFFPTDAADQCHVPSPLSCCVSPGPLTCQYKPKRNKLRAIFFGEEKKLTGMCSKVTSIYISFNSGATVYPLDHEIVWNYMDVLHFHRSVRMSIWTRGGDS
uniref:Uncharacterized protein n=1 Tax=Setaria viridis TaxID=4556 RepID=A0A4U6VXU3_SETVI|nr:hypothetical protein SEVIR_2G331300v2 [Setaria viridis]